MFLCFFFSWFILHALHILCFSLHYFFYCQTWIWVFVLKSSNCYFPLLPNCYFLKKKKKKKKSSDRFCFALGGGIERERYVLLLSILSLGSDSLVLYYPNLWSVFFFFLIDLKWVFMCNNYLVICFHFSL